MSSPTAAWAPTCVSAGSSWWRSRGGFDDATRGPHRPELHAARGHRAAPHRGARGAGRSRAGVSRLGGSRRRPGLAISVLALGTFCFFLSRR